jgi:NAD+ diphosphatase
MADHPLHPKNVFTRCPRCGSPGFAPCDDNSIRCPDCALRWYYNAACAVDVILERDDGRILMTRRARDPGKGMLDFPGGFVSPDESVEQAARREVEEEVGIRPAELVWFGSFPNRYEYGGVLYFAVDLIFRAQVADPRVLARDDVAHACFVDPADVEVEDIGLASTRQAFAAYLTWRKAAALKGQTVISAR